MRKFSLNLAGGLHLTSLGGALGSLKPPTYKLHQVGQVLLQGKGYNCLLVTQNL